MRCFIAMLFILVFGNTNSEAQPATYCNPINIDYTYMIYNSHEDLSYRSGADPAVVRFRDEYYMFVTRSMGYWYSKDMDTWKFIKPQQWYFQGSNAPAAFNYRDSVLYMAGNPSGSMSVLFSEAPEAGVWQATPSILHNLQDPSLFIDDDGQAYVYWGSSNTFPVRARKLDKKKRFRPSEEIHEFFNLDPVKHGWERFGENHSDTINGGYIEGPWMNKINGKYYLQYAAPGTEFNVYGDGTYIGDNPLGPFTYAPNNPFSYKPGGFINGAGHGSTVLGPGNQYWHFSSMSVGVSVGWERRIGMFPTFVDKDGLLYSDTRFGDYPHYAPSETDKMGAFTGWMLLSYKKPVKVSTAIEGYVAENLVDENVKTFWLAKENNDSQWIEIDLEKPAMIKAIQINYNDYKADLYGKVPGLFHQYIMESSLDGIHWDIMVDKGKNKTDVPNDYTVLQNPVKAQHIRYRNIHVPTPNLSISDIRVFGNGFGKIPKSVKNLKITRSDKRRGGNISWDLVKNAQGYNVLWGIAPDKLYSSWMIYDNTTLDIRSLNTDQAYYFSVEAFNENGVSPQSPILKLE